MNMPSNISYTLLVHKSSYDNFTEQIEKYPSLKIRYEKIVSVHYFVIQIEDTTVGTKGVSKDDIYRLPIMAMREEFSNYVFFKNVKTYNNVLKRMCEANTNKEATYDLMQYMLTTFEKSMLIDLDNAKSLTLDEYIEDEVYVTTYCDSDSFKTDDCLLNLFVAEEVTVDDEERVFTDLIKKNKWMIGII